ncbi:MAG: Tim44 domain-containing protein [Rickettsiaceae bacterium H1]|nr:Tim44 domain-containing protein [Rickettsiaceae bacterium H1]
MLELAVYAVIATFIISKLYSTLGKSSGVVTNVQIKVVENQEEKDDESVNYPQFKSVIESILKKDSNFSLSAFMQGAEKAFEIIIDGINKNDIKNLEHLLSKDLYRKLKQKIDNRVKRNEFRQITIISIKSKEVQTVELVKNNVNITIKFVSEKTELVRMVETNEIIQGDPLVTQLAEDIWSFTRNVRSGSAKWLLTAV